MSYLPSGGAGEALPGKQGEGKGATSSSGGFDFERRSHCRQSGQRGEEVGVVDGEGRGEGLCCEYNVSVVSKAERGGDRIQGGRTRSYKPT